MLGPLHIEEVFIKAISDWLEVHEYVSINSDGRADSFLTCSDDAGIKGSRYAHRLPLASLATLASKEFKSQVGYTDFKA